MQIYFLIFELLTFLYIEGLHCPIITLGKSKSSLLLKEKSNTSATTRSCDKLWLVEGCIHMDLPSSLHQPQLPTWVSYDTSCGTKIILKKIVIVLLLTSYVRTTKINQTPNKKFWRGSWWELFLGSKLASQSSPLKVSLHSWNVR